MKSAWPAVWELRQATILAAFEELVERVRTRVPALVARNGTSANPVKPIHIVRSFARPGRYGEALVLSTMFTFSGGELKVHCNLMREDGPILRDLGTRDLGERPALEVIDGAVAAVVAFVNSLDDAIVAGLEASPG